MKRTGHITSIKKIANAIVALLAASLITTISAVGAADPKVDRLIELLRSSRNYRVRVQAAYSLAEFPSNRVRRAIAFALTDPHEAVRIAALVSLTEVGDASSIQALREFVEENKVVREQARKTLVLLEERFPNARLPVDWKNVKGIIEIGGFSDKSGSDRRGLDKVVYKYLKRHIRMQEGLAVADSPGGLADFDELIRRYRIKPFYVTPTVTSMSKRMQGEEVVWEVAISITVLDHPGKSIRAVMSSSASSTLPAEIYTAFQNRPMQEMAFEDAFRDVIESFTKKVTDIPSEGVNR